MSGMVLNVSRTLALATAAFALAPDPAGAEAWQPTKNVEFIVPAGTGGGADQMARMIQGIIQKNGLMENSLVVINKSGGAGAEASSTSRAPRAPAQDRHHALEPVHDAARDRHPVQLAGHHAGRHAGAGRVHPLGQREVALPDHGRLCRRAEGRPADQDGRDRVQAGGSDHHRRRSSRRPAPRSPTSPTRAAATSRRNWSAGTSIPASTIRSRRWRSGAPASCGPCASSATPGPTTRSRSRTARPGPISRPARRAGSTSSTTCCAASSPRPARRPEQVAFYVDLMEKVRGTADWQAFMDKGAFKDELMTGDAFTAWLTTANERTRR